MHPHRSTLVLLTSTDEHKQDHSTWYLGSAVQTDRCPAARCGPEWTSMAPKCTWAVPTTKKTSCPARWCPARAACLCPTAAASIPSSNTRCCAAAATWRGSSAARAACLRTRWRPATLSTGRSCTSAASCTTAASRLARCMAVTASATFHSTEKSSTSTSTRC